MTTAARSGLRALMATWLLAAGSAVHAADRNDYGIPSSDYMTHHTLVAIDQGRRLNLFCLGSGRPTVLLDAGLGSPLEDWRKIQGPLSRTTRVCSYERAGYGFSDASPSPSDARHAVSDLHKLVLRAPIRRPFVLVGHSLGGLFATMYATDYPTDLRGLVLIEPAFPHIWKVMTKDWSPSEITAYINSLAQYRTHMKDCLEMAKAKSYATAKNRNSDCLDYPANPDPVLHLAFDQEYSKPSTYGAIVSEGLNEQSPGLLGPSTNDLEMPRDANGFGDLPLIVLTADGRDTPPGWTALQLAQMRRALRDAYQRLAAGSTRGANRLAPGSGHFIQTDRPDIVLDAIRTVIGMER